MGTDCRCWLGAYVGTSHMQCHSISVLMRSGWERAEVLRRLAAGGLLDGWVVMQQADRGCRMLALQVFLHLLQCIVQVRATMADQVPCAWLPVCYVGKVVKDVKAQHRAVGRDAAPQSWDTWMCAVCSCIICACRTTQCCYAQRNQDDQSLWHAVPPPLHMLAITAHITAVYCSITPRHHMARTPTRGL